MAGSLLCSVGLPELIAETIVEYEDKAVAFAGNHVLQQHCKEKLLQAKTSSAAMNTQKFVADFSAMAEQLVRGQHQQLKVAAQ
jgi:predicted O-linked N-acetylglucosamine transferase (SPINDLY family)